MRPYLFRQCQHIEIAEIRDPDADKTIVSVDRGRLYETSKAQSRWQ